MRKSKLSKLSWFGLIQLDIVLGMVGAAQIVRWTSTIKLAGCNYGIKIAYSIESIILFNLAALIVYKVYFVCQNMSTFTETCTLPDEAK